MASRTVFLLLVLFLHQVAPLYLLNRIGYLKLPSYDASSNDGVYKLFGGTAEESAYDAKEQILYVVGEESYVLHIIDVSNPRVPKILLEHRFLETDGIPLDVEVCGTILAVSLSSPVKVYDGHVKFFKTYSRDLQTFFYESRLPVGVFPDNMKFTSNCGRLVVANEGVHGKDPFDRFSDPEGSISIINIPSTGSPNERIADFNQFNSREDIRHVSKYAPNNQIMAATLAQDIEPEYIEIVDVNTAYITLQENNAIARVDLKSGVVTHINNLGSKDWSNLQMDASDRDGGIHMRSYPIHGLYQPDVIKSFKVGKVEYLVTANEGSVREYTKQIDGLIWSDGIIGDELGRPGNLLNEIAIDNQTFVNELGTDSRLGRLLVSRIDGTTLYGLQRIYAYGGRGFSIWKAGTYDAPVYDSGDEIEQTNAAAFGNVFNTDCASYANQSPETLRDTTSDNMGPKLNGLDVVNDNGTVFMALGSETMGVLYLYVINTTSLTAELQNVKFEGGTSELWSELYANNNAGNSYISDVQIIPANQSPNNETLIFVVSNGSGAVAIYQLTDRPDITNPLG